MFLIYTILYQVQTLAMQFKLCKGDSTLPGFARDMALTGLITDTSGIYSEPTKVELLNFLVAHDAGWWIRSIHLICDFINDEECKIHMYVFFTIKNIL